MEQVAKLGRDIGAARRRRRIPAAVWRRIIFTVLVSNTDDHLRNHGFLYAGSDGWTLSPTYDLNPVPVDVSPRLLSNAIDSDDQSASVDLAFSEVEYFELDPDEARNIAADVAGGFRVARIQ